MRFRLRIIVVSAFLFCLAHGALLGASKTSGTKPAALGADYASALATADRFLQAWQTGDLENGTVLLTVHAREKLSSDVIQELFSSGAPAAYEITRGRQLHAGRYEFPLVLLENSPKHPARRRFSSLVVLRTGNRDWAIDKLP